MDRQQIPWTIFVHHLQGSSSAEEEEQLATWLADASHVAVYAALRKLWLSIQQEGADWKSDADLLWARMEARMNPKPKEIRIPLSRFRWGAVAAVIVLLLSLSVCIYTTSRWIESASMSQRYQAMNGKSQITLPDGSHVWLNTDSELQYNSSFWSGERSVTLEGEALFDVKHDDKHPFVVRAHGFAARVHGTRFSFLARQELKQVYVGLLSGSVSVKSSKDEQFLQPGEEASCNRLDGYIQVQKNDVAFNTLWAGESLHFDRQSLRELVPTLSRWYGVRIQLDPTLQDNQAYTFTIHNEPLEEVLRLMARIHPISYSFDEKNHVTINRSK
ncbi:MAG: FecR family protein [Parabacteroides sp.]